MIGKRIALRVGLITLAGMFSMAPAAAAVARGVGDVPQLVACIREASGGRGWLEKTLWGLRDQEGGWVGAEVPNSNGSYDLGPLQINSFWVPRLAVLVDRPQASVRNWLKNDPCFNVQAARWIFLTSLGVTRDYWKAIGVYHSPIDWRQRRYAGLVAAKLLIRFGPATFVKGHGDEGSR